jgi:phage tail sheath protein FI
MPQYLSPGVYVEEMPSGSMPIEGVGTAVAAFVGIAEKGPFNEPTLVTNWTQFTSAFGEFVEGTYLAHAVYGFFNNGGGSAFVVRIGQDGPGAPKAKAELPSATQASVAGLRLQALEAGPTGNDVSVEVADASEPADDTFKLVVKRGGRVEETYDNVSVKKGKTNVATIVNTQSKLIQIEETAGGAMARPANGAHPLSGGSGSAPVRVTTADYVGDSAKRTGFGGLEAIDPITMVACPDLMAIYQRGGIDLEGVQAVQTAMMNHCELMGDRVAILDAPPGLNAQQVREWRQDKARYDSKYASLYWPWLRVFDPGTGQNIFVPPSGHMAGIWARNDTERGVHKAPANEVVRGAIGLETNITKGEHDLLNPVGINCIRAFPGRGIRVWGARTISSDPSWRYLNVRRLFNYIEESIFEGTQWVVFEPNDQDLWERVKRTINAFLFRCWREGMLFGASSEQAYYVKCDEETNPVETRDVGQLIVEIGIAPVKPAEFVIFRIAQFSGNPAQA